MSRFPNTVQACLLFDRATPFDPDALVSAFVAEQGQAGVAFKPYLEPKPGQSYRLVGSNNVMVCLDFVPCPAEAAIFEPLLGRALVEAFAPDARERIERHASHLYLRVSHGLTPPSAEAEELLAALNLSQGATFPEFKLRLDLCARLATLAHGLGEASLVHWPRADHLLHGDMFAMLAKAPAPSLLQIHFHPSGVAPGPDGRVWTELTTTGLSDFLGHEAHILASPIPWTMAGPVALSLLAWSAANSGAVPTDGATFSPADEGFTCRVRHVPYGARSGELEGPLFQLEILEYRKFGYRAPQHAAAAPPPFAADVISMHGGAAPAAPHGAAPVAMSAPAPAPAPEPVSAAPAPAPQAAPALGPSIEEQRQAAQRMMPAVIAMRQRLQSQDWSPMQDRAEREAANSSSLRRLWKAGGR